MKVILLLSLTICCVTCIKWKDCGSADAIWRYTDVSITPIPINYPDPVDVQLTMHVSKDVPVDNLQLKLSIDKLTPQKMHIPCLNNFGSCDFDYCDFEKSEESSKDLYGAFAQVKCEVKAGTYNFNLPGRTMPILGKIFQKVLEGSFDLNATYVDSKTGQVYGCVNANFDLHVKD